MLIAVWDKPAASAFAPLDVVCLVGSAHPRSALGLTWRAPFLRRERDQSLSHRRLGRAATDDGNQRARSDVVAIANRYVMLI
jgi:hypothetical protein